MSKFKASTFVIATAIIVLFFISCSKEEAAPQASLPENHMKRFEESVLMKTNSLNNKNKGSHKEDSENKVYATIELQNFDENFQLHPYYTINGEDFNDDGTYNDEIAGDGIYTSLNAFDINTSKQKGQARNKFLVSDKFKYKDQLASSTSKITLSCKFTITYEGKSSWFGNSCSSGCIKITECEFEWEW